MTVLEVLLVAWATGLVLERRGDQILIHGLQPNTPPELLDLLREYKPALLALMTDQSAVDRHSIPVTERTKS